MNFRPIRHSVLLAALAAGAASAAPPPSDAVLIHHATVRQAFLTGGAMEQNDAYKIIAGRRVVPGVAELHRRDTDIFYITAGAAILVTGGSLTDLTSSVDGEVRAQTITGGTEQHLREGDVIIIPAGTPHWFKSVEGDFRYFVVKVTSCE